MTINDYPIRFVYSKRYSFALEGLSVNPLLSFLSKRFGLIAEQLQDHGIMKEANTYHPDTRYEEIISSITTTEYREFLMTSKGASSCFLRLNEMIDEALVEMILLDPMRMMTMGTLKAAQLSYSMGGLSINIGGGFHHARQDSCGGFCIYNDILAAAKWLWENNPKARILYIDFDAHLGDGVLDECANDARFFHYDIYNTFGFERIDNEHGRIQLYGIPLRTKDPEYLGILDQSLEKMFEFSRPDFVFYNAGSDPLEGDELGLLNLSPKGLKKRDDMVVKLLRKYNLPAIMTLSGGYTLHSVDAVVESIENFFIFQRN